MVWNPYVGSDALFLSVALFAIGFLLIFYGTRLKRAIKIPKAGGTLSVLIVACWILCLALLLVSRVPALLQIISRVIMTPQYATQFASILWGPVFPITLLSAIFTFIGIGYLCRACGLKVALVSAFVGTAAAPMIFELPFLLIMMIHVKGLAVSVMLSFYLPLFLAAISTISLLLLSSVTNLSNYAIFSLGGMFIVFAVWAFFGFSYPSDLLPFSLNEISKVLSFTTAIMLFLKPNTN
jgi:hypothetical protein